MDYIIAVIDDGVSNKTIKDLKFNLFYQDGRLQENVKSPDCFSHGSICAAIIKKYAPEAAIGSICVLDENRRGNLKALLTALNWCINNNVRLINLSIGSVQASDILPLYEMVNNVVDNASIIIAACKNDCNSSYPASFQNVIGVRTNETLVGFQYMYNQHPNGGIEFSASPNHIIQLSDDTLEQATSRYNSFAAPVITAAVFNYISINKDCCSLDNVRAALCGNLQHLLISDQYLEILSFEHQTYSKKAHIIAFLGNDMCAIMENIVALFLYDNLLPLTFTRFTQSYNYDFYIIEDINIFLNSCHAMAEYYESDFILIAINVDEQDYIDADVFITGKTHIKTKYNKKNISIDTNCQNINSTYDKILYILGYENDSST